MQQKELADQEPPKDSCATEVFLFGDVVRAQKKPEEATVNALQLGLAVNKDAVLLDEVPLYLADVKNFFFAESSAPVKPGVQQKGQGCQKCHNGRQSPPDDTAPFPWEKVKNPPLTLPKDAATAKEWFTERCSGCHGEDGGFRNLPKKARANSGTIMTGNGRTLTKNRGMPANKLTDGPLNKLIDYIEGLK